MSRTLLALSIASALMLSAAPAMAAGTTTGYGQTTPAPTTTTPQPAATTPKPSSGTGPSKETATPKATSSEPSSKSTTPSSSTPSSSPSTASSRSTLPFTGLDLRWVVGIGVLLLGAGLSIRLVQRRQRQDLGR
jgi:uncharacterized membrane protein